MTAGGRRADGLPDLDAVRNAAVEAGGVIMEVYESGDLGVETKSDDSPLTRADTLSHELIASRLSGISPDIPVLSEEGKGVDYEKRRSWKRFYLVDPLDGTKSFIKRSGEFTVNIALVEDNIPVMGVIYSPVSGTIYFSSKGEGAYRSTVNGGTDRISVQSPVKADGLVAVISRSHSSTEKDVFAGSPMFEKFTSAGSSLKFCLVAEGRAHLYPRFGQLWEWDTAAGHAILNEAGGRVVDPVSFREITYNKRDLLHNGLLAMPDWLLPDIVQLVNRTTGRDNV